MSDEREAKDVERNIDESHVHAVRLGHGANCSSLGSVVDTLFATATVGAAVFAAVIAALAKEPRKMVPAKPTSPGPSSKGDPE